MNRCWKKHQRIRDETNDKRELLRRNDPQSAENYILKESVISNEFHKQLYFHDELAKE